MKFRVLCISASVHKKQVMVAKICGTVAGLDGLSRGTAMCQGDVRRRCSSVTAPHHQLPSRPFHALHLRLDATLAVVSAAMNVARAPDRRISRRAGLHRCGLLSLSASRFNGVRIGIARGLFAQSAYPAERQGARYVVCRANVMTCVGDAGAGTQATNGVFHPTPKEIFILFSISHTRKSSQDRQIRNGPIAAMARSRSNIDMI